MARCPDCIHQYCCKYDRFFGVDMVENKCNYFKNKADVAEVKHGEWVDINKTLMCSVCGIIRAKVTTGLYNYCPNCGAKMDKKESEGFSDV